MSWMQLPGFQLYRDAPAKIECAQVDFSRLNHDECLNKDATKSFEDHTEIKESPGRGLGLFATKDIPAYSLILSDYVFLGLFNNENLFELFSKYEALSKEDREVFDTLTKFRNSKRDDGLAEKLRERGYDDEQVTRMVGVSQRFLSNAFNIDYRNQMVETRRLEDLPSLRRGIFAHLARINHSCVPNAHVHFQPSSKSQVLYSLRSIHSGEEIVIAYFDITLSRDFRLARARDWGFDCSCPACWNMEVDTHEEKLATVRAAFTSARDLNIGNQISRSEPELVALKKTLVAIGIAENTDGLQPTLPILYDLAGDITTKLGTLAVTAQGKSALEYYEKARDMEINITGHDSPSMIMRRQKHKDILGKTQT